MQSNKAIVIALNKAKEVHIKKKEEMTKVHEEKHCATCTCQDLKKKV